MTTTNPLNVPCPNCQAGLGHPCTRPTSNGRVIVTWFHEARADAAEGVKLPASPIEALATTLLATLEEDSTVTFLACDCGRDLEMSSETTVAQVQELIEHAAFDHTSRREIDVYRSTKLLTGYEMGVLLRLAPQTEAEEKWRRNRA